MERVTRLSKDMAPVRLGIQTDLPVQCIIDDAQPGNVRIYYSGETEPYWVLRVANDHAPAGAEFTAVSILELERVCRNQRSALRFYRPMFWITLAALFAVSIAVAISLLLP